MPNHRAMRGERRGFIIGQTKVQLTRELLHTVIRMKRNLHSLNISDKLLRGASFAIVVIGYYAGSERSGAEQGVKISDLSRILGVSRPAVTKMINNLEEDGYVTKSGNRTDRRYVYVQLTEKGQEALTAMERTTQNVTDRLVQKLGPAGLGQFLVSLNKVSDVFAEELKRKS